MKREDVKGIVPSITEEQLQQIMDLHSSDIGSHKQSIDTLKAERDAARTQLADANKKLEGYDPEWKQKAADAEQEAAAQVSALKADYAAENAAAGLKFSSASAKKAFLADLKAKGLTLQDDGTLLGFDDYVASYKKNDPGAFAKEAGYPAVKDGGDPAKAPTGSTRDQFAAWFNEQFK